jgi:hypothetical protein
MNSKPVIILEKENVFSPFYQDMRCRPFDELEYAHWKEVCHHYGVDCFELTSDEIILNVHKYDWNSTFLWGSIELQKQIPFIPSAVNWHKYSNVFFREFITPDLLFNKEVMYVKLSNLCNIGSCSNSMFIKAISGDKVVNTEINKLHPYYDQYVIKGLGFDPKYSYVYVAVSPDRSEDIGIEVRCICHKSEVISSAIYITLDGKIVQPFQYGEYYCDKFSNIRNEADTLLSRFNPYFFKYMDDFYVMDICEDKSDNSWKILEINCFSTSGIYGNDVSHFITDFCKKYQ